MNIMKKTNKSLATISICLALIWTITALLAGVQGYALFGSVGYLPLGLVLACLVCVIHYLLYRGMIRHSYLASAVYLVYALSMCIPLLLQFYGAKQPGLDTLVAAALGIIMIASVD